MHRAPAVTVVVLASLIGVAACNGDKKKAAPVGPTAAGDATGTSTGSAPATGGGAALPADQQCLWLNVCDQWQGCAHIRTTSASAGTVIAAPPLAPGDPVDVLDMCSGEPVCIAARGVPEGVTCPPHTTLIFIPEPAYTCAWNGSNCVSQPKAKAKP